MPEPQGDGRVTGVLVPGASPHHASVYPRGPGKPVSPCARHLTAKERRHTQPMALRPWTGWLPCLAGPHPTPLSPRELPCPVLASKWKLGIHSLVGTQFGFAPGPCHYAGLSDHQLSPPAATIGCLGGNSPWQPFADALSPWGRGRVAISCSPCVRGPQGVCFTPRVSTERLR